jgi:hypothetical protein
MSAAFYDMAFLEDTLARFDRAAALCEAEAPRDEVLAARKSVLGHALALVNPVRLKPMSEEQRRVFALVLREYTRTTVAEHEASQGKKRGGRKSGIDWLNKLLWQTARVRVEAPEDGPLPGIYREIIDDPLAAVEEHRVKGFVEKLAKGWRVPAMAFEGGAGPGGYAWQCPHRVAAWVYGTLTHLSAMHAEFRIEGEPPAGPGVLEIEGQDWDNKSAPTTPIQIRVNGRLVFEGPNGFVKQGWSRRRFDLPAGLLKRGENRIEIRNTYVSDARAAHWFMLSEAKFLYPD